MRQAWRFSLEEGGPQRLEIVEADEGGLIVLFDRAVVTANPIAFPSFGETTLSLADGSALLLTTNEDSELCVCRDQEWLTGSVLDLTRIALQSGKALAYPTLLLLTWKSHGMFGGVAKDLVAALEVPYLICVLMLAAVAGAGYRVALLIGAVLLIVLGGFDALYWGFSLLGLAFDALTVIAIVLALRGYRAMAPIRHWCSAHLLRASS